MCRSAWFGEASVPVRYRVICFGPSRCFPSGMAGRQGRVGELDLGVYPIPGGDYALKSHAGNGSQRISALHNWLLSHTRER